MPQVVKTTVYRIDELQDAAEEQARSWYRQSAIHDDWHDCVFDDFEAICRILGIMLRTSPVPLYGGGSRENPHVYYRGFWSQGDGASFEGTFRHARGAGKAIRAHAPQDTELHRIADALQAAQRPNFYQLHGSIRQQGRYCHENTMMFEVERDSPTWQPMTDGAEEVVTETLRDLARWLYRTLRSEYEHQTSDDAVDEVIAINEWTFTAEGKRFG